MLNDLLCRPFGHHNLPAPSPAHDLAVSIVVAMEQRKLSGTPYAPAVTRCGAGGWDVISFDIDGEPILIDVQTSPGTRREPLQLTRQELARLREILHRDYNYRIYHLYDIRSTADYKLHIYMTDDLRRYVSRHTEED